MKAIIVLTIILSLISLVFDRRKTLKGIKKGLMMFVKILPTLLSVIIIVSIVLHFTSNELMMEYLGDKAGLGAYAFAAIIGSVSIIP